MAAAAFDVIDNHYNEGNGQQAYELLKEMYDEGAAQKQSIDILWRLARACNQIASHLSTKNPKKRQLLIEGQKYAQEAIKLNPDDFNANKWAAVLTGEMTEFLPAKEKIQQGYLFKGYLDKALSINSNEFTLLHMRGRFAFSVASLSWLERSVASAIYATPPKATFQEAITDFLEVERIKPGQWIENLLFLAKSYIGNSDKPSAIRYLKIAAGLPSEDEADKELLHEVNSLLKRYK